MFHISDWLPTFLSWAGASHLVDGLDLDGMDQAVGLKNNTIVRKEVLLGVVCTFWNVHSPPNLKSPMTPYGVKSHHAATDPT